MRLLDIVNFLDPLVKKENWKEKKEHRERERERVLTLKIQLPRLKFLLKTIESSWTDEVTREVRRISSYPKNSESTIKTS